MSDSRIPWGYLYETTNLVNGMLYVGIRKGPKFVESYLGSGVSLKKDILRFGRSVFEVRHCAWAFSKAELEQMEKAMISERRRIYGADALYNIASGGYPGNCLAFPKHTEESKRKMSASQLALHKRLSPAQCEAIRIARTGSKASADTRSKMSVARRGQKHSKDHCRRIAERLEDREFSAIHRERLGMAKRGRPQSSEHIAKRVAKTTGQKRPQEFCERMREQAQRQWANRRTTIDLIGALL